MVLKGYGAGPKDGASPYNILLSSPRGGGANSYSLKISARFARSKEPSRNGMSNSCTKEVCDDCRKRVTIQLSMGTRLRVCRKFLNFCAVVFRDARALFTFTLQLAYISQLFCYFHTSENKD